MAPDGQLINDVSGNPHLQVELGVANLFCEDSQPALRNAHV
ncbi:hypothetical protein [Micromonospora zamorensis]|nr:hypothetical protein [Micromonospora zamorensis]